MSTHPTQAEIKAVRHALYKRNRLESLKERLSELAMTMNLNPTIQLQSNDIRNPSGSGPNWFLRSNGSVDPLVREGADLCDKIAHTILEIRHDVGQVGFPASDKDHLMMALQEEAASWTARGKAWRAPDAPHVEAVVSEISAHDKACIREVRHVQPYLKTKRDVGV